MRRLRTHFEQIPVEAVKKIIAGGSLKMATSFGMEYRDDGLQYPDWQSPVQGALLELDRDKLKARVAEAEAAIFNRLQAISQDTDHTAERQAIEDALANLRVVKRESLGFPDWEKK
jgi:hypothetical protein